MANALYPIWKQQIMKVTAGYNIDTNTSTDGPYAVLFHIAGHAYSASDQFFSAITAGVVGAASGVNITSPVVSVAANFDGNDVTFTAVSGSSVDAIQIYRHNSGANTTWPLVMYYDTSGGGLPVTPNGGDISIVWNASGIFTL